MYWVKAHSHWAKVKAKTKFSLMFEVYSLIFFVSLPLSLDVNRPLVSSHSLVYFTKHNSQEKNCWMYVSYCGPHCLHRPTAIVCSSPFPVTGENINKSIFTIITFSRGAGFVINESILSPKLQQSHSRRIKHTFNWVSHWIPRKHPLIRSEHGFKVRYNHT